MKKSFDFIANTVSMATEENASIDKWLVTWKKDIKAFLKNWLGDDVEKERNGRTDLQMVKDLVKEIKEMRKRNLAKLLLAECKVSRRFRKPSDGFCDRLLNAVEFEDTVDALLGLIE